MYGFGELEAEIMDRFWVRGNPLTVRQVYEDLRGQRDSAYSTVMTVMGILCTKGYLTRERQGRAWRYEATATREEYAARLMREVLNQGQDTETVLTHFLTGASREESQALRTILNRLDDGKPQP